MSLVSSVHRELRVTLSRNVEPLTREPCGQPTELKKSNEAQQDGSAGKALATKPEDLSSVPGSHVVGDDIRLLQVGL